MELIGDRGIVAHHHEPLARHHLVTSPLQCRCGASWSSIVLQEPLLLALPVRQCRRRHAAATLRSRRRGFLIASISSTLYKTRLVEYEVTLRHIFRSLPLCGRFTEQIDTILGTPAPDCDVRRRMCYEYCRGLPH